MKNGICVEKWKNIYGAKWIWVNNERENQYIGALAELKLPFNPSSAKIAIFADCKYKLYINGHFVSSGPAPFWKPVLMIDEYDIFKYLKKGMNKIFVLSFYAGIDTKYNMKERPGLISSIETNCGQKKIISVTGDNSWKVCELNCWDSRTPRKNWAIEQVEDLDLNHPDFAILSEYASDDYFSENAAKIANHKWKSPRFFDREDLEIRRRIVPLLRWKNEELKLSRMIFRGNTELYNWQDTTVRLDHEHVWQEYEEKQ